MNEAIFKAQQFVNKVRESGVYVSAASVFGSQAKGLATLDSDIDVCVVSPEFGKDYIAEMVNLRRIALSIDSRLEPLPVNPEDLSDPYWTLGREIQKNSLKLK